VPYTGDVLRPAALRHVLFVLGLVVAIAIWFVESPDPESWIGRKVAPRYLPAVAGYRQLLESFDPLKPALRRNDQGFGEVLEIAAADASQTTKTRIAVLRLEGLGMATAGHVILVHSYDAENRKVHRADVYNAETALKQRFFERSMLRAKATLSGISIILLTGMYVLEVAQGKRNRAEVGF
jgi:hypothetical protein